MLAVIQTRACLGVTAPAVSVEVHLSGGLPSLSIVGLPEAGVRESRERVRSAILNSGFEFPARRITINLAPADLPKEGGRFDLPIALGILVASGQVSDAAMTAGEFVGELSLDGSLRAVRGVIGAGLACRTEGKPLFLPEANRAEAALASESDMFAARHLTEVCSHLNGETPLPPIPGSQPVSADQQGPDLADVSGQPVARRALEIAAAGGHNLLFFGPPGTGKSMLAARLPGILPPMEHRQALEVAAVYSVAGVPRQHDELLRAPFRAPHHTASTVAMVGGGSHPRPGEISLAHQGVLFLDELPEFPRSVLEVLREPMESGHIAISRAARQVTFPAQFQVVAAMNPCPCGYYGHPRLECQCSASQVARYQGRVSGPLLDRFDLHVEVPAQDSAALVSAAATGESSQKVRERVLEARERQVRRGLVNQQLAGSALRSACALDSATEALLTGAMDQLGLSGRALNRVLKVARTLADLDGEERIHKTHVIESLSYRQLDRRRADVSA